jgi:hypothetical protein
MNAKFLLATVAIAAAASGVARADDADPSQQFAIKFQGTRTRAEVMAEAAKVPATRSQEPAGSRVIAPLQSSTDVKTVRAEAVQALRSGKIPSGEFSL